MRRKRRRRRVRGTSVALARSCGAAKCSPSHSCTLTSRAFAAHSGEESLCARREEEDGGRGGPWGRRCRGGRGAEGKALEEKLQGKMIWRRCPGVGRESDGEEEEER